MDLSYEEKLKQLGMADQKIAYGVVDMLYAKHLEQNKPKFALELLNKLLTESNYEEIENLDKLAKQKIIVADIYKIDSKQFLLDHKSDFYKIGLDIEKDFDIKLAETRKKYANVIIGKIANCMGYELVNHITSTKVGTKEYKNVRAYKFIKNV